MFTPGLITWLLMMIAPMCTSIGPSAGGTNVSVAQDGSWNAGSGLVLVNVNLGETVDVDVAAAAPATGAPTARRLTAEATAARRRGEDSMGFSSFRSGAVAR